MRDGKVCDMLEKYYILNKVFLGNVAKIYIPLWYTKDAFVNPKTRLSALEFGFEVLTHLRRQYGLSV